MLHAISAAAMAMPPPSALPFLVRSAPAACPGPGGEAAPPASLLVQVSHQPPRRGWQAPAAYQEPGVWLAPADDPALLVERWVEQAEEV